MEIDWQHYFINLKQRSDYIWQSEKLADCRFLVGPPSNQSLIAGHRLFLAMASPVFEQMFYGSFPEKNDPIRIPDIQPDIFRNMLSYIYTEEISIASFAHACELHYAATKYMLPQVVRQCLEYLRYKIIPQNACHAYEFATLFDEPQFLEASKKVIKLHTLDVIEDPSFIDIEGSTLMYILDQNDLNIDSELDLFNCVLKLANEHGLLNDEDIDNTTDAGSENESAVVKKTKLDPSISKSGEASTSAGICNSVPNVADKAVVVNSDASASGNASESYPQRTKLDKATLRKAVKKIRFLAMTPQQFAEGPAKSKLLTKNEVLSISMKILCPTCPMPEGFCKTERCRRTFLLEHYIVSPTCVTNFTTKEFYSQLTFNVNTNISLTGVLLKSSHLNSEFLNLSACIKNMEDSEIAHTHLIENIYDTVYEVFFRSPVAIQCNQNYTIAIELRAHNDILMHRWSSEVATDGVKFNILGVHPSFEKLDTPIGSIIFLTSSSFDLIEKYTLGPITY